ncbi:MAG: serine/threonine-protein kinase [Proteobacteria bacterium]|nr:serine/threonine-protein kinase [Pseudomonadota bacterium]
MPETGDLVGPYRLITPLGKGAMGEVWRARDERLDRYVALKIMPPELERDVERRSRMLREARTAAAIRHVNVVTLFDIVKHADDDILVMELVEGRTLSETLRKDGAPDLATALRWLEGIADALVAAHAQKILHRDIKAANIMVTPDGGVKVLDFGLAKLAGDVAAVMPAGPRPPPTVSQQLLALDATMPSEPISATSDLDAYRTHAGQLIGTPLYMAPEQLDGGMPDARSEVFSVGILAYEVLTGKPPYTATTITELFAQIAEAAPPALTTVPGPVAAIVARAVAKAPDARFQTMAELRDAIAAERTRLFSGASRRRLLAVGVVAALAIAGGIVVWQLARAPTPPVPPPARPGDSYVARAVEEYDLFYGDKALSSLRAAIAVAPDHPRANAYTILFGGATDAALAAARRVEPMTAAGSKDRALLDAAIALVERGPRAARAALAAAGATSDRELAFWTAEFAYRAGDYADARDAYQPLAADPQTHLRGRIFDHYSSVLLYLDEPAAALQIGQAYRDAFPGEADAVGVHATTLAAAGRFPEAIAAAEEALRLNEGEDTLAGLAKVVALSGDRARARGLYQRSLDRAPPARRPLRRAALALLQWIDGDAAAAATTVTPCFPGGDDASARERGACLFVGAIVDPARVDLAARTLDALAADATDTRPAYGAPATLAALVRARATFLGGGCVGPAPASPAPSIPEPSALDAAYARPTDFYAAYHVPYAATWAACEHAALLAATGKRAEARAILGAIADRAPNRAWIVAARARIP